jgi:hypothetical protein
MTSVVITEKHTGDLVAQIGTNIRGQNYIPSAAEHHAQAWRIAIDDGLLPADADKDDYKFELVPVTIHNPL